LEGVGKEYRQAAASPSQSMLAAFAMTLLKLAAGLLSGSLGVLSDAAHSGLDLVGSALTLFSVRVSDKPADEDHTYGHAKFENLSAFAEAGLMAVSCAWIIWEAMQRIFNHGRGGASLGLAGAGARAFRSPSIGGVRALRKVAREVQKHRARRRRLPLRLRHLVHARRPRRPRPELGWAA
jgi:cation diffusion facilitator family transporter